MTATATLDGILDAIIACDPLALPVARDYALDHLGANTPEEVTARLIDVAADRGMDTLRAVMRAMGRQLVPRARLSPTKKLPPASRERWLVAGTGVRVVSHNQQDGIVIVLGTARLLSVDQQSGMVFACDTSQTSSLGQQGGYVFALNAARLVSRNQQGGRVIARNSSHVISRARKDGGRIMRCASATVEEVP